MTILDLVASRELLVVTGKGGVGKSAVAATLGRLISRTGRKTLILEVDPRENLHQLLSAPPSGGEILQVGPDLYLQNLQPKTVVDRLVCERVRFEIVSRRVLASPVYKHFSEGAPGLKEMAVLGHAFLLSQGRLQGAPRFDNVILDAPATGHGVALLTAPLVVSDVIRKGPVATLTAEVAEMVASPDRCGVAVVTLAEEMPVSEALELNGLLRERLDRDPDVVVVNRLYPAVPPEIEAGLELVSGSTPGEAVFDPSLVLWTERRRLNDRELHRLRKAWRGPRVELPLLPLDRSPELVDRLARRFLEA